MLPIHLFSHVSLYPVPSCNSASPFLSTSLPSLAVSRQLFSGQSSGINFDKYDDIPVEATGDDVPDHVDEFDSANLCEVMNENLKLSNYTKPTPVQKYSIPIVAGGRDLMACAQTGSGKTAAFLVPILNRVFETGPVAPPPTARARRGKQFPLALVLAPTRELASQIYDDSQKVRARWARNGDGRHGQSRRRTDWTLRKPVYRVTDDRGQCLV